jgi:hypothetical protein
LATITSVALHQHPFSNNAVPNTMPKFYQRLSLLHNGLVNAARFEQCKPKCSTSLLIDKLINAALALPPQNVHLSLHVEFINHLIQLNNYQLMSRHPTWRLPA